VKRIAVILIFLAAQVFALEVRINSKYREWSQNDSTFMLMATIYAGSPPPQQVEPLQVLYLVDVGDRFAGNVRQEFINGGIELVKRLADTDFFGIILYNEYSFTLLPLSEIGATGRGRINKLLSEISTERRRMRDPLSALERVVAEFTQNEGRRNDGRALVMSVLGETYEDGAGNAYDKKFIEAMNKLDVAIYTIGHGDDFDEDAAISAAEKTGGRAYFVGRDRTDLLENRFESLFSHIVNPHSKNITIDFATRDGVKLTKIGNTAFLNKVKIPKISTNDTVNLFFEAQNRPRRSSDVDVDFEFDNIAMRANMFGNSSFKINLTRGSNDFAEHAPKLLRFQLLYNMAKSVDELKIGDRHFRRDYADGFRRLLETRLTSIRNEINTREAQQLLMDMVALYDMIAGGTASNGLIAKQVKYMLHYCKFSE